MEKNLIIAIELDFKIQRIICNNSNIAYNYNDYLIN